MRAKICDRCGVTYTKNNRTINSPIRACIAGVNGFHLVEETGNGGHNHVKFFDLCDDCIDGLFRFLDNTEDA